MFQPDKCTRVCHRFCVIMTSNRDAVTNCSVLAESGLTPRTRLYGYLEKVGALTFQVLGRFAWAFYLLLQMLVRVATYLYDLQQERSCRGLHQIRSDQGWSIAHLWFSSTFVYDTAAAIWWSFEKHGPVACRRVPGVADNRHLIWMEYTMLAFGFAWCDSWTLHIVTVHVQCCSYYWDLVTVM